MTTIASKVLLGMLIVCLIFILTFTYCACVQSARADATIEAQTALIRDLKDEKKELEGQLEQCQISLEKK